LDKMKVYDEEKLKAKFEKFANGKQLAPMKNYLGNFILKTLRETHGKKMIDLQLHEMMADAIILEKRGLDQHALKKLKQIEGKALRYEKFPILIDVCRRRVLLHFKLAQKGLATTVQEEYELMEEALEKINQTVRYEKGLHELYVMLRTKNTIRTPEERAEVESMQPRVLQDFVLDSYTFHARIAHFFGHAVYHQLLGDRENREKAVLYYKKVIELWERDPLFIQEYPKLFLVHASNYLTMTMVLGTLEQDEFDEVLDRMKAIEPSSFDEEAELFQTVEHIELLYLANYPHSPQRRYDLRDSIREKIEKYQSKINPGRLTSFYFNLGILFFLRGEYEESLEWFNEIYNMTGNDHRQDLQRVVRLLRLVVFVEGQDYAFAETTLDTTRKWLQRTDNLLYDDFERILLQGLRKVNSQPDPQGRRNAFEWLEEELDEFRAANPKQRIIGLNEIQFWVQAHLDPGGSTTPFDILQASK
ncbi:MAG: hypothetical protein KDC44_10335, partial [Phaeodactylibacter sp.]|nr:hypothetical protein [Phaeodactylibacter sp.]